MWSLACAGAYSVSSILGKELIGSLGVPSVLLLRFALAAAVCWIVVAWRRSTSTAQRLSSTLPRRRLVLFGLAYGSNIAVGFLALDRLPASTYIVLVYTFPTLVAVGSTLLGESIGTLGWGAVMVTATGIAFTVPDLRHGFQQIDGVGVALALTQASTLAVYLLATERMLPNDIDSVASSAWTLLGAAAAMTPAAGLSGVRLPTELTQAAQVTVLAVVCTVAALVALTRALQRAPASLVATLLTSEIVLAIVLAMVFLGERPSAVQVAGAALVAIGVAMAQRARHITGQQLLNPQP
jgi:drug/metabolite transporter (DMT)-like permease